MATKPKAGEERFDLVGKIMEYESGMLPKAEGSVRSMWTLSSMTFGRLVSSQPSNWTTAAIRSRQEGGGTLLSREPSVQPGSHSFACRRRPGTTWGRFGRHSHPAFIISRDTLFPNTGPNARRYVSPSTSGSDCGRASTVSRYYSTSTRSLFSDGSTLTLLLPAKDPPATRWKG